MNSNKQKHNVCQIILPNEQMYLKNKFTLSNLVEIMPTSKIFILQTDQIEFGEQQNFSFGTLWYTIKLPRSKDNSKRILYYSLLCYIFQICQGQKAQNYQHHFIQYVIEKLPIILPYRPSSQMINAMFSPLMTTNQIKACFLKFINILKKRQQISKFVLQQLNTIPQIDFIFMSIIHMYVRKQQFNLQFQLKKIQNNFGIKTKITQVGYCFDDECHIQRKYTDDRWQRFFVKRIDIKKIGKASALKRKQTTQSVGQIQQNGFQSRQQLDNCLHYPLLINAKFVESYQNDSLNRLYNQVENINQCASPFIKKNRVQTQPNKDQLFTLNQCTKLQQFQGSDWMRSQHRLKCDNQARIIKHNKKTSFFQSGHYQIIKLSKQNIKNKQRVKTQVTSNCHDPYRSFQVKFHVKRDKSPNSQCTQRKTSAFFLSKSHQNSKSQKQIQSNNLKCSFSTSQTQSVIKKQRISINYNSINGFRKQIPQKRQTLQKISFNYRMAHIQTC